MVYLENSGLHRHEKCCIKMIRMITCCFLGVLNCDILPGGGGGDTSGVTGLYLCCCDLISSGMGMLFSKAWDIPNADCRLVSINHPSTARSPDQPNKDRCEMLNLGCMYIHPAKQVHYFILICFNFLVK